MYLAKEEISLFHGRVIGKIVKKLLSSCTTRHIEHGCSLVPQESNSLIPTFMIPPRILPSIQTFTASSPIMLSS